MIKQFLVDRIEERYNPEHDVPEGVEVTWVDAYLLEIIQAQQGQIEKLQVEVKRLAAVVSDPAYAEYEQAKRQRSESWRETE